MTRGHDPHDHSHAHDHHHHEVDPLTTAAASDASDADLTPAELSRRGLLRAAGITGALAAGGMAGMSGVTPAMAEGRRDRSAGGAVRQWLPGDHHIHTQYSSDAMYRVIDQAQHAAAYGLDWLVITDHGGATHARIGVDLVNPDIRAARAELPETLIFQGLE